MKWILGERFFKSWYRLFYNLIAVLTLIPIILADGILSGSTTVEPAHPLEHSFSSHPADGGVLALDHRGDADRCLSVYGFASAFFRKRDPLSRKLVTGGFYRFVRHPIYTFRLAVLWFSPFIYREFFSVYHWRDGVFPDRYGF